LKKYIKFISFISFYIFGTIFVFAENHNKYKYIKTWENESFGRISPITFSSTNKYYVAYASSKIGFLSVGNIRTGKQKCLSALKMSTGEYVLHPNKDVMLLEFNTKNFSEEEIIFKEIDLSSCKVIKKYKIKVTGGNKGQLFYFNNNPMYVYYNLNYNLNYDDEVLYLINIKKNKRKILPIKDIFSIYYNQNIKSPILAFKSSDNIIYFDVKTEKLLWVHNYEDANSVSISKDGIYSAYSLNEKNEINIFNIKTGKKIKKIKGHSYLYGFNGINGDLLVYHNNIINIYSKKSNWNKKKITINLTNFPKNRYGIPAVTSFSFNKNYLLLGNEDAMVSLFRLLK